MKLFTAWPLCIVTLACSTRLSMQQPDQTKDKREDNINDHDPLKRTNCNFTEFGEFGPRFREDPVHGNTCNVNIEGKPTTFAYACNGVSHPWNCPQNVIYRGHSIPITSLFHQVTIRRTSPQNDLTVRMATVLVSKNKQPFLAHCSCQSYDGQSYKMIISSRMKQVLSPGFLTVFLFLPLALQLC